MNAFGLRVGEQIRAPSRAVLTCIRFDVFVSFLLLVIRALIRYAPNCPPCIAFDVARLIASGAPVGEGPERSPGFPCLCFQVKI